MQKKIIALAIVAAFAAPVAMADTANVNVYGSLDAGMTSATAAGSTSNNFGSGTYNSNRWGIKGSEDLGDGMKAFFGLEQGINTGTGATSSGAFDRNATVGVSSGDHAIELGRQYSVAFKTIGTYDPFGFKFINIAYAGSASNNARFDNDIAYTGKFGAVKVMAEHNMGNSGYDANTTSAVGVTFDADGLNVGGAYSITKPNAAAAAAGAATGEVNHLTVGAGYKFGDAKVTVGYAKKSASVQQNLIAGKQYDMSAAEDKYYWVGGSYNVSSKIGVTAAIYKYNTAPSVALDLANSIETTRTRLMAAATYALSKRTNFYAQIDKTSVDAGGGSVTADSNGYSLGLATTF